MDKNIIILKQSTVWMLFMQILLLIFLSTSLINSRTRNHEYCLHMLCVPWTIRKHPLVGSAHCHQPCVLHTVWVRNLHGSTLSNRSIAARALCTDSSEAGFQCMSSTEEESNGFIWTVLDKIQSQSGVGPTTGFASPIVGAVSQPTGNTCEYWYLPVGPGTNVTNLQYAETTEGGEGGCEDGECQWCNGKP